MISKGDMCDGLCLYSRELFLTVVRELIQRPSIICLPVESSSTYRNSSKQTTTKQRGTQKYPGYARGAEVSRLYARKATENQAKEIEC